MCFKYDYCQYLSELIDLPSDNTEFNSQIKDLIDTYDYGVDSQFYNQNILV